MAEVDPRRPSDPPAPARLRVRVILADDSPVARHSIASFLESLDTIELCAVCDNGRNAVEAALRLQPDVAILDLQMPVMGGLEAARIFRSCLPMTAIIMTTVHDHPEIRAACMASGADAFASKAVLARTFDALLKTALDAVHAPSRRPAPLDLDEAV